MKSSSDGRRQEEQILLALDELVDLCRRIRSGTPQPSGAGD
jgi:hypothetical protein